MEAEVIDSIIKGLTGPMSSTVLLFAVLLGAWKLANTLIAKLGESFDRVDASIKELSANIKDVKDELREIRIQGDHK